MTDFLPVCRRDMQSRGWDELDFLFVTGDAYVDHPSFGHALLTRLLEREGYRVGILAQPAMADPNAFRAMGTPRLGVLVSSGVLDSMVDNYTAARKRRARDAYSPGGKAGRRPDRALIAYCRRIREAFGDIPVVVGGLEASLRRFAHYDYWADGIMQSVLVDCGADLMVYGNGERALLEICELLARGVPVRKISAVRGTCWLGTRENLPRKFAERLASGDASIVELPSAEAVLESRETFARAFMAEYREQDAVRGRTLVQEQPDGLLVVQNPPQMPMTEQELDGIHALPYMRAWHPQYAPMGGVPAIEEVSMSITAHRGCFGGCTFCAIGYHQGRVIQPRSRASIVEEARLLTTLPEFKGYIHDVGGPTANFHHAACRLQAKKGVCAHRECLYPQPCPQLDVSHDEYLAVLREVRSLPRVRKVFVRSGVRYDYAMLEKSGRFLQELVRHHVSGQLKVAPEHVAPRVLDAMGKPRNEVYRRFVERFERANASAGCDQYLVPYYISGHPGCTLEDAVMLAESIRETGTMPEQVQQFIPVPGTLATAMYWSGLDPRTMKPIHVPKTEREQKMQRALLQFGDPKNRATVREALREAGREDLIGFGPKCLAPPAPGEVAEARVASRGNPRGKARSGKQVSSGAPRSKRGTAGRSGTSDTGGSRTRRPR